MSKTEHTGGRVLLALGVLLAALFVLSFCLGRYGVDAGTTCRILLSPLLPLEPTWTDHEYTAVMNIRLPRIVLACLVGCCLSSAGAAYQGVFQNPMASPDVLGASSGASFGAALAILAGAIRAPPCPPFSGPWPRWCWSTWWDSGRPGTGCSTWCWRAW